jgi:two-component system, chemotaxis family, protein-glutamate methylesterase/glutaminase
MTTAAIKRIRVLVVDDSAFMRRVLHGIISADPGMEVVGQASDGREAVKMAESLHPDVITMDLNMPHMDGLQATEHIMSMNPRPIVVVSSESRDGAASTLRALELGAVEFVAKPSSAVDLDMNSVREGLLRKLKMAAKVRVVRTATRTEFGTLSPLSKKANEAAGSGAKTPPAATPSGSNGKPAPRNGNPASAASPAVKSNEPFPLIVVAASTGGPATLMRFIPRFPKDFPAAIFVVQHMPATFTTQFSQQLGENTPLRVKEAEAGEVIQPGTIYICPGSSHLRIVSGGRIALDNGPRIDGYLPCADVTLESAAAYGRTMTLGVVLTGMGNDASRGVKAIKAAGGLVIAQNEDTSVIFGMPAEAIKTGAVDHVLALDDIFPAIEKRVLLLCGAGRVGGR